MHFWFKVINVKKGRGQLQVFHSKAGSFTFQQQGVKKKFAVVPLAQLRVRFPQYAHLSEA